MAVYQAAQNCTTLRAGFARVGSGGDGSGAGFDCFLAAGHVCAVTGFEEYFPIAARYRVPIVVTGFEPIDILQGLLMCVRQLEEGRAAVENQYTRAVRREGNAPARRLLNEVFRVVPRKWRGIGEIPRSGLALRTPTSNLTRSAGLGCPTSASKNPPRAAAAWCFREKSNPQNAQPSATDARRSIRWE